MLKLLTVLVVLAAAYAEDVAVAYLSDPTGKSTVTGEIVLTKTSNGITIIGLVSGLSEGSHGFHVHELGDLSEGCNSTGSHFNPDENLHGGPDDDNRHAGDLGNIVADEKGVAIVNLTDSVISFQGIHSVIGRSLVVHADEDDLGLGNSTASNTTGNAGAKIACGVIGIKSIVMHSGSSTFTMFPLLFLIPVLLLTKF